MATITFEITKDKTTVAIDNTFDTIDITGTEVEKGFIRLLKKITKYQRETELQDAFIKATDVNSWKED